MVRIAVDVQFPFDDSFCDFFLPYRDLSALNMLASWLALVESMVLLILLLSICDVSSTCKLILCGGIVLQFVIEE